jgi:transposase
VLDLRRAVGTEVGHRLGANKPAYKLDPGFLEHPRLSPGVVTGSRARFLDFYFRDPTPTTCQEEAMEVLHPRCSGLDVHKETVVACLRLVSEGKIVTEVRTFDTTTAQLIALSEWLAANECTHVAMEATGVYWKPVWHILDDGEFKLVLANAAHVKNVPGRKTDVGDAAWLADLLAHGLIRASFVPDTSTQELRTLLRTRKQLVREEASHILRVQKTLEDANIKLDSVISDVMGKSGRAMIEALIGGESDPDKLARFADRRVKASQEKLREALRGRVTNHHRFLLRLHLNQIDALDAAIATIDRQVEANLAPFQSAVELVASIPGIKSVGAQVIVSEIGIDMSRFPSEGHLISWAGICPRNDESAGKRRSNRLRKGAPWLKTTLVQCAWAAVRKKGSYLQAQFYRIRARRGPKKAIMAVAASILTAIYHMLKDGTLYHDLGADHFQRRSKDQQRKRLVQRLVDLGYAVELSPRAS